MSKNLKQVYDTNPITTMISTDIMYSVRSPYSITDDAGVLWGNIVKSLSNDIYSFRQSTHADSTFVLTDLDANIQYITLNNADQVNLPVVNTMFPSLVGRPTIIYNNGEFGVDSAYDIFSQDGVTPVYERLLIGQTLLLTLVDESTANGIWLANIIDNNYIQRRIINGGGDLGTTIAFWEFFNTVIEITTPSDFTIGAIGSNGILSGVNWWFKNNSTGNLTFTPSVDTIDLVGQLILAPGESCQIICNGLQFETISLSRVSISGYTSTVYNSTFTSVNPLTVWNNLNPQNNNQRFKLPAANAINSMKIGVSYVFQNVSTTNNAVIANVANTTLLTIRPLEIFVLVLTSNSTANGSYDGYPLKSMAFQSADNVDISGGQISSTFIDGSEIGGVTPAQATFTDCDIARTSSTDNDYFTMRNLNNTLNLFIALSVISINSSAVQKIFSDMLTTITDRTAGSEDATLAIQLIIAGALTNAVVYSATGASFNGALSVSDASGTRTNLGLGTIATQNSNNVIITGGSISGVTYGGLGTMATQNANAVNITGGSISGVTYGGLGTISTQNANSVVITGGSITGTTVSLPTTEVTGTSQALATNNNYIANNAGLVTLTLPSTFAIGDRFYIAGKGAGGWKIAQNASQLIHLGNVVTTTGTGGSLASTNRYDSIIIEGITANTELTVLGAPQGEITYV